MTCFRTAEAEPRQGVEIAPQIVADRRDRALRKFEHDAAGKLGVVLHEGDEIAEEAAVVQRVLGDVADEAELEIALAKLPQKLNAAEQQHVIDGGVRKRRRLN